MNVTEQSGRPGGRIFVVSAPSGAGKTTICKALMEQCPGLHYSVSHTTRLPRCGEIDGRDYHFVSEAAFKNKISNGRMVEWAVVYGNYYGTSTESIDLCIREGKNILLDIDVQGTKQLLERYPQVTTIFIMPPSIAVLEQRLIDRGTDNRDVIAARLHQAEAEMKQSDIYQHVIVNNNLGQTIAEMIRLVAGC